MNDRGWWLERRLILKFLFDFYGINRMSTTWVHTSSVINL